MTAQKRDAKEWPKPKPALDANGRFQTGNIGGGRQIGSRNKLGEAFLADLQIAWQEHGKEVIKKVIETKPADSSA